MANLICLTLTVKIECEISVWNMYKIIMSVIIIINIQIIHPANIHISEAKIFVVTMYLISRKHSYISKFSKEDKRNCVIVHLLKQQYSYWNVQGIVGDCDTGMAGYCLPAPLTLFYTDTAKDQKCYTCFILNKTNTLCTNFVTFKNMLLKIVIFMAMFH